MDWIVKVKVQYNVILVISFILNLSGPLKIQDSIPIFLGLKANLKKNKMAC